MSSSPGQPLPDSEIAPADSGLRCPQCEYNLTGLTEHRCPECGAAFDPEELHAALIGAPQPIPGWDDRGGANILTAFFRICWMTWFHPSDFARRFPRRCHRRSAITFWLVTRLVVAVVLGSGLLALNLIPVDGNVFRGNPWLWAFAAAVFFLVAPILCEALVALILGVGTRTQGPGKHRRRQRGSTSWWGFLAFLGGFLIISAVSIVAALGVGTAAWDQLFLLPPLVLLGTACLGWWYAIARRVVVRGPASPGGLIGLLLIPVAAITAIGVAVVLGWICLVVVQPPWM